MSGYQLTQRARAELLRIVDYVASDGGADRAESVLGDILAALELLALNPRAGHLREDLTDEPLRFWTVHDCLIVYRPETDPLQVIHVLSGWRDVAAILEARGDP